MKKILAALLLSGAVTITASANTILSPGDSSVPQTTYTAFGPQTLLANGDADMTSPTFNANFRWAVYKGADDFSSCGSNCLTYVYQLMDQAPPPGKSGVIEHLTQSSFAGFQTSVGVTADPTMFTGAGFVVGTAKRYNTDRNPGGDVITWDYVFDAGDPTSGNLHPGETTPELVIATNSVNFDGGFFSAIDGTTAFVSAFEPTSAAPEPATFALFGGALIGLGLLRKRSTR